ncbi:MAG TPA: phosphate ABC transporter substrate-binding/OmpA family protein, partial [Plasticicumulans sp.]|nr:phosphate ABC transporter substrate-binding/OmpA family protein [Plasticicumulans sp.]
DVRRVPGARAEEMRIEATLPGSEGRIAIELAAHGSGTAFTDLADGRADVGAASRPVRDEEIRKLAALGDFSSPAAEHVIGLDGVAIIVHPANPLRSLSREQVAKLFAGEIRDWAELGGRPGPVHIYARDERSGTWDTFQSLVLGKAYPLSPEAQRFESSPELSDRVATDAGGIGFIGLPYVRMARALAIGDGNAVPSAPSPFTVATEDYPLSRRLFFYLAPTGDNRMARELVEFALENDGQQVVEAHGFISQRVAPQRVALSPNAPKEYESLTRDALRLSVNFRFRPGSGLLDGKAQRDLRRVTDYLAQAENRSRQVLLFGFTDARGSPEQNLRLSQQRAQEIARELQARGIQTRVVRGFGPANPVAADDSPSGQERNRRVEIWVM